MKWFYWVLLILGAGVHDFVREGLPFFSASVIVWACLIGFYSKGGSWRWGFFVGLVFAAVPFFMELYKHHILLWSYFKFTAVAPGIAAAYLGGCLRGWLIQGESVENTVALSS